MAIASAAARPAGAQAPDTARAAGDGAAWTPPPLFESDDVLAITIRTDLRTLIADRDSVRRQRHAGTLRVAGADGTPASLDVELRTRGHYRRQSRICDFPPIQVRFPGRTRGTPFARQEELKLVTRCQSRNETYEQYILQEYAVYRMYNAVTPHSFRARLVRVTYEDTQGRHPGLTTYAFFIEPEKDLARRMEGKLLEARGARLADLDTAGAHLMAMFQYLAGNTDWSIPGLHNVVLVQRVDTAGEPTIRAVPYDLDWSGIVNTRYAVPDYRLPIRSVRERLYRGYCVSPAVLRPAIARLEERRPAIEAAMADVPDLDPRTVESMRKYVEEFYALARNEGALGRQIERACVPP